MVRVIALFLLLVSNGCHATQEARVRSASSDGAAMAPALPRDVRPVTASEALSVAQEVEQQPVVIIEARDATSDTDLPVVPNATAEAYFRDKQKRIDQADAREIEFLRVHDHTTFSRITSDAFSRELVVIYLLGRCGGVEKHSRGLEKLAREHGVHHLFVRGAPVMKSERELLLRTGVPSAVWGHPSLITVRNGRVVDFMAASSSDMRSTIHFLRRNGVIDGEPGVVDDYVTPRSGVSKAKLRRMAHDVHYADGGRLEGQSLRDGWYQRGSFSGANMRRVDFRGADLRLVNFARADLTGAKFEGANTEGAFWIGATRPDGTQADDNAERTCEGHF